ncbi:MAG: polysaccharide deacetylase family protein [Calditrichaeota bacterium]|nr:polysaccharide deacetylase family protein [Calditrichota bacterium]
MEIEEFWAPYQGAVSLTFDDGTVDQLQKAVPILEQFALRGTFYLNPHGEDWEARCAPWREVARRGHEIGNHTLSHPCSCNVGPLPRALESMTLAEIEADITAAQARLQTIAPHQRYWTFAYPCSCTFVGRGKNRQSYVPVVARHFLAGRIVGEYGFGNSPALVDLACVWGLSVERMSGFEMIGLVEELTARGQWVVLVFHEIDGERLTVGSYDFRMLLAYLRRRDQAVWTAPVFEVAKRIAEFQAMLSSYAENE